MDERFDIRRREFFKQAAGVLGTSATLGAWTGTAQESGLESTSKATSSNSQDHLQKKIIFPRIFRGNQLKMLAFPLGGVTAGSIALGGRGQLRDWEIFNRPNKGYSPSYAFPAIRVQAGQSAPVTRVLEARLLPPFEGQDGLGADNVPGLSRLETAEFTGQYPLAKVKFEDRSLPVQVELQAFSPFIPHAPGDSGLPVAIMRYRIHNPGRQSAKASIAFSIENPVKGEQKNNSNDPRLNELRVDPSLRGIFMTNPGIEAKNPMSGSFTLVALTSPGLQTTCWKGWPKGKWWNSPMLFWDSFSRDGELLEQPAQPGVVGALCQSTTIPPGESVSMTFFLAWHFPNRTPGWCGWDSPAGMQDTIIGNYYSTRFKDAWEVVSYTATNLDRLESKTRLFVETLTESTLPDSVKEAASANLSTLASTTCFRTADGEFHGFEGSGNKSGCCFGNCMHVWNYETATTFLFPSYARSLREAAFGYSMDDQGGLRFRQLLPDGKERFGIAAADGQMGQILHAYIDWRLTGDKVWLAKMWPRIKKAIEFAWIPGGWDPSRRGVFDGVQHTTYDVEFFGPNPLGSIFYLAALRAAEELALAVGDKDDASSYRKLFERGSEWVDKNLFQGEYYIQQVRGIPRAQIAPQLISGFGTDDTEKPEYQVGGGSLVDQLLGQCLAHVGSLGPLVSEQNVRTTLESIYRYNYKRSLVDHDTVQRTYALNDESAVVICDYGTSERPRIPFPYYAESWTGLEYAVAAQMFYSGMIPQGVEYIENLRSRYDGIKRNPWDEAECGHHYARAMASWTSIVALSGFDYDAPRAAVTAVPRYEHPEFRCFWSTGLGWGSFSYRSNSSKVFELSLTVLSGKLPCRSLEMVGTGNLSSIQSGVSKLTHQVTSGKGRSVLTLQEEIVITEGSSLRVELRS
jgi:uncharacterized protein (DUF608 family)